MLGGFTALVAYVVWLFYSRRSNSSATNVLLDISYLVIYNYYVRLVQLCALDSSFSCIELLDDLEYCKTILTEFYLLFLLSLLKSQLSWVSMSMSFSKILIINRLFCMNHNTLQSDVVRKKKLKSSEYLPNTKIETVQFKKSASTMLQNVIVSWNEGLNEWRTVLVLKYWTCNWKFYYCTSKLVIHSQYICSKWFLKNNGTPRSRCTIQCVYIYEWSVDEVGTVNKHLYRVAENKLTTPPLTFCTLANILIRLMNLVK